MRSRTGALPNCNLIVPPASTSLIMSAITLSLRDRKKACGGRAESCPPRSWRPFSGTFRSPISTRSKYDLSSKSEQDVGGME